MKLLYGLEIVLKLTQMKRSEEKFVLYAYKGSPANTEVGVRAHPSTHPTAQRLVRQVYF